LGRNGDRKYTRSLCGSRATQVKRGRSPLCLKRSAKPFVNEIPLKVDEATPGHYRSLNGHNCCPLRVTDRCSLCNCRLWRGWRRNAETDDYPAFTLMGGRSSVDKFNDEFLLVPPPPSDPRAASVPAAASAARAGLRSAARAARPGALAPPGLAIATPAAQDAQRPCDRCERPTTDRKSAVRRRPRLPSPRLPEVPLLPAATDVRRRQRRVLPRRLHRPVAAREVSRLRPAARSRRPGGHPAAPALCLSCSECARPLDPEDQPFCGLCAACGKVVLCGKRWFRANHFVCERKIFPSTAIIHQEGSPAQATGAYRTQRRILQGAHLRIRDAAARVEQEATPLGVLRLQSLRSQAARNRRKEIPQETPLPQVLRTPSPGKEGGKIRCQKTHTSRKCRQKKKVSRRWSRHCM
jgi:hypothetical protein